MVAALPLPLPLEKTVSRSKEKLAAAFKAWRQTNPGYLKAWRARNAAKTRAYQLKQDALQKADPERIRKRKVASKKRYYANVEKARAVATATYRKHRVRWLEERYGLPEGSYAGMLAQQGERCAICGLAGQVLQCDHDHGTGTVRGLLCHKCNKALGLFGDDADRLRLAVRYLEARQSEAA